MEKRFGKACVLLLAVTVLAGAERSDPGKEKLLIRPADVTLRTEPDTSVAQYYTLSYSMPEGVVSIRLERAILELYVNVRAKARDGYINEAPVLEVYALKQPYGGHLEPEKLDRSGRTVRPVILGDSRRVVLDVTKIVRSHLNGELPNNGLIVGSVTGRREGKFTLVSGKLPEGAVGQIRFYMRDATR